MYLSKAMEFNVWKCTTPINRFLSTFQFRGKVFIKCLNLQILVFPLIEIYFLFTEKKMWYIEILQTSDLVTILTLLQPYTASLQYLPITQF